MASCLEDLPAELAEAVACLLDLHSICSLRSTCRSLAAKCSFGCFRSNLQVKILHLEPPSLEAARQALQSPVLSESLRALTVVGIVPNTPSVQHGEDRNDLAQQLGHVFTALKAGLRQGQLQLLRPNVLQSNDLDADREQIWRSYIATAIETVQVSREALHQSGLLIEKLDLFSRASNGVRRCILPINHVFLLTEARPLQTCLSNVKQLSLSLSHTFAPIKDDEGISKDSAVGSRNISALSDLFRMMSSVEELDLHWFNLKYQTRTDMDKQEEKFFDICYQSIPSNRLRKCVLRGIHVTQNALLGFIDQYPIRNLTLQYTHLCDGTYRPVLDALTRSKNSFEYFHLDDLVECDEDDDLVHYKVPGKPKFRTMRGADGPSDIIRQGAEVQQNLEYSFARGRPLGSPENRRWDCAIFDMYGPPDGSL